MTKQEKVAVWMQSLGFKLVKPFDGGRDIWFNEDKQVTENQSLATFFYDVIMEAERSLLCDLYYATEPASLVEKLIMERLQEKHGYKPVRKSKSISEHDLKAALQVRRMADKINADVRHLKQEGKTNAR